MPVDIEHLKNELVADRIALREGLERATAAAGAADREHLRWVLRCDRAELWRHDGCRSMAQWLSGMLGISNWKARRWIEAAYVLEHLVHIPAALERGALSLDKTVELTRFATPATEKKLVSWARRVSVGRVRERADEETQRSLKEVNDVDESRYLRWWWEPGKDRLGFAGMLPADQGAVFTSALDKVARELPGPGDLEQNAQPSPAVADEESTMDQRRADALVLLVSSPGRNEEGDRTTVVLHAPFESLAHDEGSCSVAGGPVLHPETARRLSCDARLQVVLQGKDGNAVGIGGRSRIIPEWLRRQVLHRDGYACTFPACEAKRFLTLHHVQHWARRGPTNLDNLLTVCSFHHKHLHELRWSVTLVDGSTPVWFRPSGRRYDPGPAPPEQPPPPRAELPRLAEAAGFSRAFDLIARL